MIRKPTAWLSGHYLKHRRMALGMLIGLAAALQLAAGVGLAYVAGFSQVRAVLGRFQWPWLSLLAGALAFSFVAYYYAYRGIYRIRGGPTLSGPQMRAVVIAGFGGFLAHGGAALDEYALKAAGSKERAAKVRVASLAGLEHGVLALIGTAAAIVVLGLGFLRPPPDFTIPWAIIPVPGFLLAFWVAHRYRDRPHETNGWRGKLAVFRDSIDLIRQMFAHPWRCGPALLGMAVFWIADAASAWAGMAAFGYQMNGASFFVGFATGMIFTRRTGPLGGAGVLALVLPVTVWVSGAPFAAAIVGMFAYRVAALWLPMPFALSALPTLREMGKRPVSHAEGTAEAEEEPGLRHRRVS